MKSEICYEWCCEYVDQHGDIQDHDWSETLSAVWPAVRTLPGCQSRLCLVRMRGNDEAGELDRGYAYPGDIEFDTGHAVPKRYQPVLIKH